MATGRARDVKWGRVGDSTVARLTLLAVAVLLLGILGYRQIQRLGGTTVAVWVAAADLDQGRQVGADDLAPIELRDTDLPPDILVDRTAIEGRRLETAKTAGAPFFDGDFAPDVALRLSELLPEGRLLSVLSSAGFPAERFGSGVRFGDRLDVLAISAGQPITVARDVFYLGFLDQRQTAQDQAEAEQGLLGDAVASLTAGQARPDTPTPLLLAVRPEDAVSLFQASAAGLQLNIVLHGNIEVERDELLELPRHGVVVEIITGQTRERVSVRDFEHR